LSSESQQSQAMESKIGQKSMSIQCFTAAHAKMEMMEEASGREVSVMWIRVVGKVATLGIRQVTCQ